MVADSTFGVVMSAKEQLEEIDDLLEQATCDLNAARREFDDKEFDKGVRSIKQAMYDIDTANDLAESLED